CRHTRTKPQSPRIADRSILLTGIEENATTAPHNRFPARSITKYVRSTQSWREVVPRGVPKRSALWRCSPGTRAAPLNRIRHQALCNARGRVHIPTQPHRKVQTLGHSPFILGKCREVCVQRVNREIGLRYSERNVRVNRALAQIQVYNLWTRKSSGWRKPPIVDSKLERVTA